MARSVNLTKRNEQVCKRFFKQKGRRGGFSKYVNDVMNREFTLDGEESIKNVIRDNKIKIERLEEDQEKLVKKLRVIIDKKEQTK